MTLTEDIRALNRSFFFIRHAQSTANAENFVAGQLDVPLSEEGEQQAHAVAAVLNILDPTPDCIVTTGLDRTRQTAAIVNAGLALPVCEEAGLGEQCFGDWQGAPKAPLEEKFGENWIEFPPGGESYEDFRKRILSALFNVLSKTAGDRILIVGHSGLMRAVTYEYGKDMSGAKNATLYLFEANGSASGLPWDIYEYEPAGNGRSLQRMQLVIPALKP